MNNIDLLNAQYALAKKWPLYIAFFLSYIAAGYLTLSVISFQSQIAHIWLPAGIALVGCYLWWWRFFPAVILASFIFNFAVAPSVDTTLIFPEKIIQNLFISLGAGLQAMLGSSLLRYWLGSPVRQLKNINTLYFVFVVGILVNLVSATIGVSSLTVFNPSYSLENFQLNLVFWWLGDSLGILISLPFIFTLLNTKALKPELRKYQWIMTISMSAVFLIAIVLTRFFIANSNIAAQDLISKEVKAIENGVYRQISLSIEQVAKLAERLQKHPDISRDNFHKFVNGFSQNTNSLQAMAWNPLIHADEILAKERQLSSDYQQKLAIRGRPLSVNDKVVYVKLISPEATNTKAIGFNIYSNPARKKILNDAMASYQPKATGIIQVVQSFNIEPGFLLFVPVFEQVSKAEITNDKRLIGFASGVFLAQKLISNAIDSRNNKLFYYEVFEQNKKQWFLSNAKKGDSYSKINNKHFMHTFNVAGQVLKMHLFVNNKYLIKQQHNEFMNFFLLLFLIVTTIVLALLLLHNRQLQLDELVNKRTSDLHDAMQEATRANQAKSQFLANMSHQIRTPMSAVIGFAQLAKVSTSPEEIKAYLEQIDSSSDLLLSLVDDILDIANIESEKLVLKTEAIDLHLILQRIYNAFEVEADKKKLTWHLHDNIPKAVNFLGDQARIEQILINLCGNAMKLTETGGVSITADLIKVVDNQAHLSITVTDSGVGLSAESINLLFDPFTQTDTCAGAENLPDFGGTGLGLTISKKLSLLMNGDIKVKSKKGFGSSFTFTCKLLLTRTKPKVDDINNSSFKTIANQQALNTQGKTDIAADNEHLNKQLANLRVLVAEDNCINQKLINNVLNKLGITPVIVENGQLAINHLLERSVDVILMDCQMPVLDGYQATKQIRAMPNFADIPIFALTADVDSRTKDKALSFGFTRYISKPIKIEQLTKSLLAVIDDQ